MIARFLARTLVPLCACAALASACGSKSDTTSGTGPAGHGGAPGSGGAPGTGGAHVAGGAAGMAGHTTGTAGHAGTGTHAGGSAGKGGAGGSPIVCGPGTMLMGNECVVAKTPPDPKAPMFGGITSVSPASTTSLFITWNTATDKVTPQAQLRYLVFLASAAGKEKFGVPDAIVTGGATSTTISGLAANQTFYAVVRAVDGTDDEDSNTVELHAVTSADNTPPTFAGATGAVAQPESAIKVSWSAATDTQTASPGIEYLVWESPTTPFTPTGAPTLVTGPGDLSASFVVPEPATSYYFIVRARDAAGNTDSNTAIVSAQPGPQASLPTFAGCTGATSLDPSHVSVTWAAGSDHSTPVAELAYDVYAFTSQSPNPNLAQAVATTSVVGQLTGTVAGLTPATGYFFLCRAKDLWGNFDANVVEVPATTLQDNTPPVFNAGLTATPAAGHETGEAQLKWTAASDPDSPGDTLTYKVYQAAAAGAENFNGAPAATVTNATGVTITGLASNTKYFWVVVASDAAQNATKSNEASTTTFVSFEYDVQVPIFDTQQPPGGACYLCHNQGISPQLASTQAPPNGNSWGDIVNKLSGQVGYDLVTPGSAANSYLYQKVSEHPPPVGAQMPDGLPALTAVQQQTIADWIDQGALNN